MIYVGGRVWAAWLLHAELVPVQVTCLLLACLLVPHCATAARCTTCMCASEPRPPAAGWC